MYSHCRTVRQCRYVGGEVEVHLAMSGSDQRRRWNAWREIVVSEMFLSYTWKSTLTNYDVKYDIHLYQDGRRQDGREDVDKMDDCEVTEPQRTLMVQEQIRRSDGTGLAKLRLCKGQPRRTRRWRCTGTSPTWERQVTRSDNLYCMPYALRRMQYALHRMPYTLHRMQYTLHRMLYTLHRMPYTLHRMPYTLCHIYAYSGIKM
jgi:hypothetical protein